MAEREQTRDLSGHKITKFQRAKRNFRHLSEIAQISLFSPQKNNCSDKFMKLVSISKLAAEAPRKTALRVIFFLITCNRLTFKSLRSRKSVFIKKSRFRRNSEIFLKLSEIPVFFLIHQATRTSLPYTHNK